MELNLTFMSFSIFLASRDSCYNGKELHCVSWVYSSMELNLTVLTLKNSFILFLRHVTAVITVKTLWPVISKYKMSNISVSLRNCIVSWVYSSMELNLTVLTLRNTFILTSLNVTCRNCQILDHRAINTMYRCDFKLVISRHSMRDFWQLSGPYLLHFWGKLLHTKCKNSYLPNKRGKWYFPARDSRQPVKRREKRFPHVLG